MRLQNTFVYFILLFFLGNVGTASAQIDDGVYISDVDNLRHELKIENDYFIHSVYSQAPAKFIKTVGGLFTMKNNTLNVTLEFNSNHENDGVTELSIPILRERDKLIFKTEPELVFLQVESLEQDLDGAWLFATRGPDKGQERRGEENPRKTLKFLFDNRFQWIAYNTETFRFHGTGGGSFSSEDSSYKEKIDFFSKDDSRVGATLTFDYEIKGKDWHHTGKNSKGEPMYEIWSKR